ncbi:hypothetical protein J6590_014152 [Homalodisca vitripennis]|nr:hypothetical protein J6590_014152 [Homalodisca vitripennis]
MPSGPHDRLDLSFLKACNSSWSLTAPKLKQQTTNTRVNGRTERNARQLITVQCSVIAIGAFKQISICLHCRPLERKDEKFIYAAVASLSMALACIAGRWSAGTFYKII